MHWDDMVRLCIYCGENTRIDGNPAYEFIVSAAQAAGLPGATVHRGVAGYGGHGTLHTAKLIRLSEDLPVIVELVGPAAVIEHFAESLSTQLPKGLLTREAVQGKQVKA